MRTSRPFTVLLAWALLLTLGAAAFAQEPILHDVRPGYGVTGIGWLSDYHAPLRVLLSIPESITWIAASLAPR